MKHFSLIKLCSENEEAMFYYDRGLKLVHGDLALDIRRRQPRGYISHAHADHMARHQLAFCTPETARLYQFRLGKREVVELPYYQPRAWGGLRLTTYPAGHILGSSMLLAEHDGQSLLYTGDFKLGPSATAMPAELPHAQILVMESTYGQSRYVHPPREQAVRQLIEAAQAALAEKVAPVLHAYTLGKAQEVTKLLTDAGIPVLQEHTVWKTSQIYAACGVDLGDVELYPGYWKPGRAVVVPPKFHRALHLPRVKYTRSIAVTGWAVSANGPGNRWGTDFAIPLSDHADFDQLVQTVREVNPEQVYCFHGPKSFVQHLRGLGYQAYDLTDPSSYLGEFKV